MNRKARLFQIANFTNLFSIVTFLVIVIYRTRPYRKLTFSDDDMIAYSILSFVLLVYVVNFYFGLKIVSCLNKEAIYFKIKNTPRIVFYVLEIITFLGYTLLLVFLIPEMSFTDHDTLAFNNIIRIIALIALLLGYPSSLIRLILTRPLIRSIALRNKHIFDELGSDTL